MSDIHVLPVMFEGKERYQGYTEIARHLLGEENLIDISLLSYIQTKLALIHEYNIYVCTANYEGYTRSIFSKYLPFPMMYNQPLKYYNAAVQKVKLIGLGFNASGFFSVAQTEHVNENVDELNETNPPLSALHESRILQKSKEKKIIRESKNAGICLNLLGEMISRILSVENRGSSDFLFCAYLYALTYEQLPDRFIKKYLDLKFDLDYTKTQEMVRELEKANIRPPMGREVPSLVNEVLYWVNA